MDLSSPRLKKVLIFAAIFTVVVFVAIKIWRRSYYSYPNTAEDAQVPITGMTQATGTVTVTATGHNFKVGDIVLLKNTGTTGITSTSGVMSTVSGIVDTPVIVATATPGTSFTFSGSFTGTFNAANTPAPTAESIGYGVMTDLKTALVACQDAYARDVINSVAPSTATATRTTCIATAVSPYTRGHCQWLPQNDGDSIPVPDDSAANAAAKTAYTTYQNDIKTIQLAYVSAANRAAAGTFSGLTTAALAPLATPIVSAARAADITGATQKYLAKVCPGFYQPGDPAGTDPSPGYLAWTAVSSSTDALPQTAGSQKHFWASSTTGITDAAILTWAQYAAIVTFTPGTGLTAGLAYLTASSITANGTTYTNKSALGTAGAENWRTAYANGPGTFPAPAFAAS